MMRQVYLSNCANGLLAQDLLEQQLQQCLIDGYLSAVIKDFRIGSPDYDNDEQFYAPFMVQFNDRQRWIVYSTTACRTDRIKGQQWDAENLKRLDATIERAFLTYPDAISSSDRKPFEAQRKKYAEGFELSYLDDICSVSELIAMIKSREDAILRLLAAPPLAVQGESDEEIIREINAHDERVASMSVAEMGRDWDIKGRSFEKELAKILNNADNLARWNGAVDKLGCNYQYFKTTIEAFGLSAADVQSISATAEQSDIGLLPNGGQPKTDVIVSVTKRSGENCIYTISCKRTNRNTVSAHQYKADDFADVLDKDNIGLRNMLHAFQRAGSLTAMPNNEGGALAEKLAPYVRKLCAWVLGGYGGAGDPERQFAKYIALYRPCDNTYAIHDVQTYIDKMMSLPMRNFSTPFSWTYASGQRGKSIQLKMPVLVV